MVFSEEEKKLLQKALGEISSLVEHDEPLSKKNFVAEDLRVLYSLGYSLYQAGDYVQAKTIFHQLLLSKPLKQTYWIGLGACLQLEKKYDEALKAWGMAVILDARDPTPHVHAAECNFALGDFDQGWEGLRLARSLIKDQHAPLLAKVDQLESYWKKTSEEGA